MNLTFVSSFSCNNSRIFPSSELLNVPRRDTLRPHFDDGAIDLGIEVA
jgi:hypothetical protein